MFSFFIGYLIRTHYTSMFDFIVLSQIVWPITVLTLLTYNRSIGARIWLYELIFSPFTDISIITTIWLRTINRLISVSWNNFQSYSATHLQNKFNFLHDFFWNFDFFFYFWPPLLIKIQFKFDFQISRVSKVINIIFFWTVFFPSSPPPSIGAWKFKKITPCWKRI
jgi:hypothetical protein